MAMERNGIVFFNLTEKYDDHPAFKALKQVSLGDVRFPFGFFLVEEDGKKHVIPGTKEDLVKRLLIAFPDYPTPSLTTPNCSVNAFEDGCEGGCEELGITFICRRIYHDPFQYYACACVDIS
jgi:hypothetical protein